MTFRIGCTEYVISCDHQGCKKEQVHHAYSKRTAISTFKDLGWTTRQSSSLSDMRCYCPEHSEDEE